MKSISFIKSVFPFLLLILFYNCKSKADDPMQKTGNRIWTDSEMIQHFDSHKAGFDTLCCWMIEDKLEFMMLNSSDSRHLNKISEEKADRYIELMKDISVNMIARGNRLNFNSVIFYLPDFEGNDKKISRGFEYRIDTSQVYNGWRLLDANEDLSEEVQVAQPDVFLYKPINNHWSLLGFVL